MKTMKNTFAFTCAFVVLLGSALAESAHAREPARGDVEAAIMLLEGHPELAETIALYPEYLRQDMLVAARHPEALEELARIQDRSRSTFARLVGQLSEHRQEMLWDVISVPGLVEVLAEARPGNYRALNAKLSDFPAETHRSARVLVQESSNVLREIAALNRDTEKNLVGYVQEQPDETRQSLQRLLHVPEVLDMLAADIGTTARLGEAYSKDPEAFDEYLAALHLQQARRYGQEAAADRQKARQAGVELDLPGIYAREASRPSDRDLSPRVGNRIESQTRPYDYDAALVEGSRRTRVVHRVYHPYPHVYRYPYWRVYHHPYWRVYPPRHPGYYVDWHVAPGFYLSWSHRLYPRPPVVYRRAYRPHPRTGWYRRPARRY